MKTKMERGMRVVPMFSKKTITCKKCKEEVKMVMVDNGYCYKCDDEENDD